MQCISPMSVPRPKGGGSADRITVPCGKCYPCLMRKRSAWSFRLSEQYKVSETSLFVTLTYDDNNNTWQVSKDDCQLFLKRLRLFLDRELKYIVTKEMWSEIEAKGAKIKYYLTAEYGPETKRPHYHMILFNFPYLSKDKLQETLIMQRIWEKGMVRIGNVTDASINYVTGYCMDKAQSIEGWHPDCEPVFSLMSKGLGVNYVENTKEWHIKNQSFYSVLQGGQKIAMPRYFKDKIFNDQEKRINSLRNRAQSDYEQNIRRQMEERLGRDSGLYELGEKESLQYKLKIKKIKKL